MTRAEWLSTLRHGDPVVLRTQLRAYRGFADRRDGRRLWVIFALREHSESATWVDPITGANAHTGTAIYPIDDERFQETLQCVETSCPLPNHHPARKIDSRPVVGGSTGIGDVEATA